MDAEVVISRRRFDAVLFDLDGVVANTATVHASAWKRTFDDVLRALSRRSGEPLQPFDIDADYRQYVDGKPRYEGVSDFLASRGISLARGEPTDPPDRETVCGIGNRKNQLFRRELDEHGSDLFFSTVDVIRRLRAHGIKSAIFSSSKNCATVLRMSGIEDLFDTKVDGIDAEHMGLAGKPDPAVLLEAARRLRASPERSVVVEDAIAGVRAGRAGGFGLIIGVNRSSRRGMLLENGAHVEVSDMSEVAVANGGAGSLRSTLGLPSALGRLDDVRQSMLERPLALFLDYDGTLTPIAELPEEAVLASSVRATLQRLAVRATVAVMSGRDLQDVRELVSIEQIYYAGSHGFELAGPGGWYEEYRPGLEFLSVLDDAEQDLRGRLATVPGARLERKRFAISVHYRQMRDEDVDAVEMIVDLVQIGHPKLRKTGGKKVFELRPDLAWDKGTALLWLLQALKLDAEALLVVYIGDDETDEDAFQALERRGITIVVTDGQDRPTSATFALRDPDEVGHFLSALSTEPP